MSDQNEQLRAEFNATFNYEEFLYDMRKQGAPDAVFSVWLDARRRAPAPQAAPSGSRAAREVRRQKADPKLATTGATAYERFLHAELTRLQSAVEADAAPLTQAADQSAEVAQGAEAARAIRRAVRYLEENGCTGPAADLKALLTTPAAPLAQQSVPIGYVANTAHGWQFRTAAPDENSQWAGMWRAVGYISAQQSEPVAIIRKKFSDLPLGTCFRYIGGSEKWVVLEHHGCGLVAGYQPHDGWVAGQSICSFADTEQECRETEVEVVLSAPLPAQQASERDAKDAARYRYLRDTETLETETLETAVWEALEGNGSVRDDGTFDPADYRAGFDHAVDRAIGALAAMGDARKGGAE